MSLAVRSLRHSLSLSNQLTDSLFRHSNIAIHAQLPIAQLRDMDVNLLQRKSQPTASGQCQIRVT